MRRNKLTKKHEVRGAERATRGGGGGKGTGGPRRALYAPESGLEGCSGREVPSRGLQAGRGAHKAVQRARRAEGRAGERGTAAEGDAQLSGERCQLSGAKPSGARPPSSVRGRMRNACTMQLVGA